MKSYSDERLLRQCKRILRLYLVWSIIYLPIVIYPAIKSRTFDAVIFLQKAFFDGVYYHLWFLPSLAVALVVVSLLRKTGNRKLIMGIAITLFVISLLIETYTVPAMSHLVTMYKNIFLTARNGLFLGTLYVLIGSFLCEIKKVNPITMKALGILSLLLMVIEGCILQKIDVVNITLASLPMSIFLFLAFTSKKAIVSKNSGKTLREMSTLIYCIHPLIMVVVGQFLKNNASLSTITTVLLTFVLSYLATKMRKIVNYIA